jgi:prophage DNA circulation protein
MAIRKLLGAKYKYISFFVRKETIDSIGQKNIIHDYPNTSKRYVERQGKEPFSATLDIFFAGLNWQENYKTFKAALENPSPGRLVLPTFGVFNNIVAVSANATSAQTSIGEISIPVTFTETIERPSPTESDASSEDVNSAGDNARSDLQDSFSDTYKSPTSVNNITTAKSDFVNLAGTINNITGLVFASKSFIRNLPKYLTNPSSLGSLLLSSVDPLGLMKLVANQNTSSSFYNFRKIAVCGANLPNAMNDIRDGIIPKEFVMPDAREYNPNKINVTINIWEETTVERKQRNKNRYASINLVRICGLISMLENAAQRAYNTTLEIDSIIKLIDLYYRELIENDITKVIIPNIKQSLDKVKILTENVLRNKRQNAFNVIQIKVERPYPSKLLTYDLYGEYIKNEDQLNAIASLIRGINKSQPAHALQGTVNVLELR